MPGGGHPKCGRQIEILLPFGVPDELTLSALPNDRPGAVRVYKRDILGLELAQF